MLASLPHFLRLPLAVLVVVVNTVLHIGVLLPMALFKLLLPFAAARRLLSRWLILIAESWIAVNSAALRALTRTELIVEGAEALRYEGWYLVISNHQSWVDIPILQAAFNRRLPFFKFFLKQQLIWVPLLGLAWWALDFPFMRRVSRAQLARNPALRNRDREITRQACQRFRRTPVSVMNFVEGTRFTSDKHARQNPPYRHLLRPRSGGIAFTIDAMGDMLQSLIDVTVVYPAGNPSLADLFANRVPRVVVQATERPIPADLLGGDYDNDPAFRTRFQQWLNGIWEEKDAAIEAVLKRPA
ncbi:MAG: acyltransferase [Lysobacteraceae bacterium]